jgi:hypothetical protein
LDLSVLGALSDADGAGPRRSPVWQKKCVGEVLVYASVAIIIEAIAGAVLVSWLPMGPASAPEPQITVTDWPVLSRRAATLGRFIVGAGRLETTQTGV